MCGENEGRDTAGVCEALSGRLYDVRPCEGVGQSDGQETKDGSLCAEVTTQNFLTDLGGDVLFFSRKEERIHQS